MGRIVKVPVAAPDQLVAVLSGNLLAEVADYLPLLSRQVPRLCAVDDIDRRPIVMRALSGLCFGMTHNKEPILFL